MTALLKIARIVSMGDATVNRVYRRRWGGLRLFENPSNGEAQTRKEGGNQFIGFFKVGGVGIGTAGIASHLDTPRGVIDDPVLPDPVRRVEISLDDAIALRVLGRQDFHEEIRHTPDPILENRRVVPLNENDVRLNDVSCGEMHVEGSDSHFAQGARFDEFG